MFEDVIKGIWLGCLILFAYWIVALMQKFERCMDKYLGEDQDDTDVQDPVIAH